MNVFNLTMYKIDGLIDEEEGPSYHIDMNISITSTMSLESLNSLLLDPIMPTLTKDGRFDIYKPCYIVIEECMPHISMALLLYVLLGEFGIKPTVLIYDPLRGIKPFANIAGFLLFKEAYEKSRCEDWKNAIFEHKSEKGE